MTNDDLKMKITNTSDQPRTYTGGIFGHVTPDRDALASVVSAALGASTEDAQRMIAGEMPKGPLRMADGTRFIATSPLHLSVSPTREPKRAETRDGGDNEEQDEAEDEDDDDEEEVIGDRELDALDAAVMHLAELSPDARRRVLQYLIDRFMRPDAQK